MSANLGSLGLDRLSDVTIGLGLNSPFGLNTRYPVDGPFNTVVTSAALPLLDIKPTIAYKFNDQLAIGVNADIYTFASFLGQGHAEQRQVGSGTLAGASLEFNGNGTGAGAAFSLLYTPLRNSDGKPIASVGLVYRTQAVLPLSGSFLVNGAKVADASTNLVLPQIFTGGIAIWPVRTSGREWKMELDVEYVEWKSNRNLDIHLSTGVVVPQPQQWKNVPVVAIGTEYKWLDPEWLPSLGCGSPIGVHAYRKSRSRFDVQSGNHFFNFQHAVSWGRILVCGTGPVSRSGALRRSIRALDESDWPGCGLSGMVL